MADVVPAFCALLSENPSNSVQLHDDFDAGVLDIIIRSGPQDISKMEELLLTKVLDGQQHSLALHCIQILLSMFSRGSSEYQAQFLSVVLQTVSKVMVVPDILMIVLGSPVVALVQSCLKIAPLSVKTAACRSVLVIPTDNDLIPLWNPTFATVVLFTIDTSTVLQSIQPSMFKPLVGRLLSLIKESLSVCYHSCHLFCMSSSFLCVCVQRLLHCYV